MRSRSLFLLVVLMASDARADEVRHTVKPGDTCAAIAQRYYGDSRLVDVLHKANAAIFSSPPPHVLKEGTVLIIPPRPTPGSGPDANLTTVRNKVEVATPETRQGKPNDPLFRGNRVSTQEASAADVTFRDESQVKLGERTLVVILGDAKSAASRSSSTVMESQTQLVTGNLRAWLNNTPKKEALSVAAIDTPAAAVKVFNGEASLSSDEPKKTTRLAVYSGHSSITAQQVTREVSRGFGSKAELGKAPTIPRPLPIAPTWKTLPVPVLVDVGKPLTIDGEYELSATSSHVVEWRVQIGHDELFRDVVADVKTPFANRKIDVRPPSAGHYFIRVAAVDEDHFEGPFSRSARVLIVKLTSTTVPATATSSARRRIDFDPPDAACVRVGNVPLEWQRGPIVGSLHEPIRLRCTPFELEPTTLIDVDKLDLLAAEQK